MKSIFSSFIEAQKIIANMKPTYCGEICFKMRQGVKDFIETIESHYTASGTRAVIRDIRDGQEYEVIIQPIKRKNE